MGGSDDLSGVVKKIFAEAWSTRDGTVVPETESLRLMNDGVQLDAVVLYADMKESTALVDHYVPQFAAEVYKAFLHCAARVIEMNGGVVTAYDGDRVMGVFIGRSKNTSAAHAALSINHAVVKIIRPALAQQYPASNYKLQHCVGIDASKLLVARTGVRGANDLVWVGPAANHAAKLCAKREGYASICTEAVYTNLADESKFSADGKSMWELFEMTSSPRTTLYGSTWMWAP